MPNSDNIMSLEDNIAAYESAEGDLKEVHLDKFVVFHDGILAGAFDTLDAAAHSAIGRFGDGPYLIRQVGFPIPYRMPISVIFGGTHANS